MMDHPFYIGHGFYLKALEKSDINETYLKWINDHDVTQYMSTGTFPTNMDELLEYYHHMTTTPNNVIMAIVDTETDRHIGNVALNNINWINRNADLGIMIGNKEFWGRGYGTGATKLMVQYGFNTLNLHKIWLGVHTCHTVAIRAYQKAGFKIEGEFKDNVFKDGKYHDTLRMAIIQ